PNPREPSAAVDVGADAAAEAVGLVVVRGIRCERDALVAVARQGRGSGQAALAIELDLRLVLARGEHLVADHHDAATATAAAGLVGGVDPAAPHRDPREGRDEHGDADPDPPIHPAILAGEDEPSSTGPVDGALRARGRATPGSRTSTRRAPRPRPARRR